MADGDASSVRSATKTELDTFRMFVNEKLADLSKTTPTSRDFLAKLRGGGGGGSGEKEKEKEKPRERRASVSSEGSTRSAHSAHSIHSGRSGHSGHSGRSGRSKTSSRSDHSDGKGSRHSRAGSGSGSGFGTLAKDKDKDKAREKERDGHGHGHGHGHSIISGASKRSRRSGIDRGLAHGSARVLERVLEESSESASESAAEAGEDDGIPMDASVNDAGVFSKAGGRRRPSAGSRHSGGSRHSTAVLSGVAAFASHEDARRGFEFPSAGGMEGLAENRSAETLQEKKELLKALDELERQGLYKPKGARLTLKDAKEEILYEYDSAQADANTAQAVDMVKGALKMGSGFIEGVAKTANIHILDGFYKTLTADMGRFNRPLTRLYKKHWRRGPISPEVELGFLVVGSLAWVVFCNWKGIDKGGSIFGGGGGGSNGGGGSGGSGGSGGDAFARPSVPPAPFDVETDTPAASMMMPPTVGAGVGPAPWAAARPVTPAGTPAPVVIAPSLPPPRVPHRKEEEAEDDEDYAADAVRMTALQRKLAKAREDVEALDTQAAARLAQLREMDIAMAQRRSDFHNEMERLQAVTALRLQAQVRDAGLATPVPTTLLPPTKAATAPLPPAPRPTAPRESSDDEATAARRRVVLTAAATKARHAAKQGGLAVTRKQKSKSTTSDRGDSEGSKDREGRGDSEDSEDSEDGDAMDRLVDTMARLSVADDDEERSVASFSTPHSASSRIGSRRGAGSMGLHEDGDGEDEGEDSETGGEDDYARLQELGVATVMPEAPADDGVASKSSQAASARKTPARKTPARKGRKTPSTAIMTPGRRSVGHAAPRS